MGWAEHTCSTVDVAQAVAGRTVVRCGGGLPCPGQAGELPPWEGLGPQCWCPGLWSVAGVSGHSCGVPLLHSVPQCWDVLLVPRLSQHRAWLLMGPAAWPCCPRPFSCSGFRVSSARLFLVWPGLRWPGLVPIPSGDWGHTATNTHGQCPKPVWPPGFSGQLALVGSSSVPLDATPPPSVPAAAGLVRAGCGHWLPLVRS